MVRGKVGAMLDTALANNLDRIRIPRVHLSDVARHATRVAALLIVFVCAILQNDSLPAVLQQLGTPFPVQITSKTSVAAIGIHEDGRLTIYFAPRLASSSDSDMLAFLYLHELGHARLGHMRPEDPRRLRFSIPGMYKGLAWQMEYDADAWAATHAISYGYDPVRGISAVFAIFGDGGGFTHPPDAVRISRVKQLVRGLR